MIKSLTLKEIQAISKDGFVALGGTQGFCLQTRNGQKSFWYRYTSPVTGKRTKVSIGPFGVVSLAEARLMATQYERDVFHGIDPAAAKKEKREAQKKAKAELCRSDDPFQDVAARWLASRVMNGYYNQNPRGASVVQSYLDRTIIPKIGRVPLSKLTHKDVFDCVKDLWATTTSAKHKCLTIISSIYKWAKAMDLVTGDNPAELDGPLGVLLKDYAPRQPISKNYPALDPSEIPAFFADLLQTNSIGSRALAFSILTASRSKPVRNARWKDIDLKKKTWTCPEEDMKMKGRGAFVVMLSDAAVGLLRSLPRLSRTDLVFPSPYKHQALTDAGLGKVITDMHIARMEAKGIGWIDQEQSEREGRPVKITQHGTARATFKTWTRTGENLKKFDRDAVELCLAHKLDDKYDGAYDRASLIEERRRVMEAWGKHCLSCCGSDPFKVWK